MPDVGSARPVAGAPIATDWGQQIHDAVEGIQYGTVNVVMSGVGSATSVAVVFARPYAAPPIVVATVTNASTMITGTSGVTATQMQVSLRHYDNTAQTVTLPVHWIAIGVPA